MLALLRRPAIDLGARAAHQRTGVAHTVPTIGSCPGIITRGDNRRRVVCSARNSDPLCDRRTACSDPGRGVRPYSIGHQSLNVSELVVGRRRYPYARAGLEEGCMVTGDDLYKGEGAPLPPDC